MTRTLTTCLPRRKPSARLRSGIAPLGGVLCARIRFIFPMHKPSALLLTLAFVLPTAVFAADAPAAPPTETVVIEHGKVDAAFAQGMPLLVNSSYKIQAGRRVTAPGQVEVHERDTDILYILEGTATFITGGKTEGGKTTGTGEIRGEKITGGTTHKLQKGDIVVVPNGTPHWFTEVSNPFLYFVVKVTK
jgi:quercetin dioxygenase-like cupin family protein